MNLLRWILFAQHYPLLLPCYVMCTFRQQKIPLYPWNVWLPIFTISTKNWTFLYEELSFFKILTFASIIRRANESWRFSMTSRLPAAPLVAVTKETFGLFTLIIVLFLEKLFYDTNFPNFLRIAKTISP